jgi:hypothetical protein
MSSSKRARYTGGSLTGQNVFIVLPDGQFTTVHVEHNKQFPPEVLGPKVPASFIDGLLAQDGEWSEYRQATGDDVKGAAKPDDTDEKKEG